MNYLTATVQLDIEGKDILLLRTKHFAVEKIAPLLSLEILQKKKKWLSLPWHLE